MFFQLQRAHSLVGCHGHMASNNETVSRQMPWAGNIAKTMTSNGKQFTITREMFTAVTRDHRWPDVVAGISAQFLKFAFVLFCYITYNNSLNVWSLGEQWILFPSNLNVSLHFVSGNIEILGKQNSLFPKGVSQGTSHSVFATVLTTSCHQIGKLKNISYMIKNLILINYFVTSLSLDVLKSVFLNFFTFLWKTFPDAMLIRAVHQGTYI